jgi:putative lipoprotein
MNTETLRIAFTALIGAALLAGITMAQETTPPTQPPQARNIVKAVPWKSFNYTCAGGAKLTVYLADPYAKVRYQGHEYLLKQTMSADGTRYSNGKIVWWGKGNGGFLQEDVPTGDGKMILQDCKLNIALNSEMSTISGTVAYRQRMALPTNAVILVQLVDITNSQAQPFVIAQQSLNLGQRQVPVPFSLKYDSKKLEPNHTYGLSAKITVDDKVWFATETPHPVLGEGKPSHVDLLLQQVSAETPN